MVCIGHAPLRLSSMSRPVSDWLKRATSLVAFPEPVPGLVLRDSYLWAEEHRRGQEEGVKDRPCAVILVTAKEDGERVVTVLPISHTPPADPKLAVEIPAPVKRRLKLDDERSWVILTEANRFIWPGPDLRLGS